jgi:hypothetical protein
VRDPRAGHDRWVPEDDGRLREVVEEADAPTEQQGHQVDPDLVEQPGGQALLDERAAAGDSKTSETPSSASATNPSRDIGMSAITRLMILLLPP